ncbi:MAG: glycerol kinase GlpK [Saprospiraceae bacterium]|nr:glycerol kinase GlpK [Saprospiraceae bacterium]
MAHQPKYILALDQGTSSSRAILFDHDLNIVGISQEEFKQYYPNEGWVEHDATEIWDTQLKVAKQVIKENNIQLSDIASIGITNQRETTILWNADTGEPLYRAIVWQDRRTSSFCSKLKESEFGPIIQEKTGLIVDAYFSASKVKWILDHVEGARELANEGKVKFGTVDSWLMYKLSNGKSHFTDVTNASRTMIFNIAELQWDKDILQHLDIPESILPEVKCSTDNFGFAEIDGQSISIGGVAGDQQAALFGQICREKGATKITYGTGCFMMTNTGEQIVRSSNQLLSTIGWQLKGEKPVYAMEGSVFVGGAIIQWLRDGLNLISDSSESEALAQKVEDSGGIVFVPALTGLGAPHWDQYARGLIIGLTRDTNKYHIARAALESIALQVNDLITAIEKDLGEELPYIKADGGAIKNKLLVQMQADISNKSIVLPRILESTALGAACLAGLSVNFWTDIEEISEKWQADQTIEAKNTDAYINVKKLWNKAIERSKLWADMV